MHNDMKAQCFRKAKVNISQRLSARLTGVGYEKVNRCFENMHNEQLELSK